MDASVLDRKLAGSVTIELALYGALLLAALFLTLTSLGISPFGHEESIRAFFTWRVALEGPSAYRYQALHHGPLPYDVGALFLRALGDSDWSVRLGGVFFGLIPLFLAWPLRRHLGRPGSLLFATLLTFSPTWLFFSRSLQADVPLVAFLLTAVYGIFRYADERKATSLYLAGVSLALATATKMDVYWYLPWGVFSLLAVLLWEGALGKRSSRAATRTVVPAATAAILFTIVCLLLYTSFLKHPEDWNVLARFSQFRLLRATSGPAGTDWWSTLPLLLLYEPVICIAALATVVGIARHHPAGNHFVRFTIFWAVGSVLIPAALPLREPSVLVAPLVPLALLAAYGLGRALEHGRLRRPLPLASLVAGAVLTLWSLTNVNFRYDAPRPLAAGARPVEQIVHAEALVQKQSTYDVPRIVRRIEETGRRLGSGTATRIAIGGESTWPLTWYLRHYLLERAAAPRMIHAPIVVVDESLAHSLDAAAGTAYERFSFTTGSRWQPLWRHASARTLVRFFLERVPWTKLQTTGTVLYACRNTARGCPPLKIDIARRGDAHSGEPDFVPAAAKWGGPGTDPGRFAEPRGLAVDATGNVYVADSKNHRIQKLDANGHVLAVWGGEGTEPGKFKEPSDVAVAPDGSVYVADTWNHRIQHFDAGGHLLHVWSESNPGFYGPRGIAVAADGTVYVTDTGNKLVRVYDADGKRLRSWGGAGAGPGQFVEPVGIAIRDDGTVVVADTGNRRIQFFRADGTFLKQWPVSGWKEFYTEPYLAVLGDSVYVTDSSQHSVARYRNGVLASVQDGASTGLQRPIGIAAGGPGLLYVSDAATNTVHRLMEPPDP